MKRYLTRLLALTVLVLPFVTTAPKAFAQDTRYFMVMFMAEGQPNTARAAHTFATFVKSERGYLTEELTVSWLPAPGYFGPNYTMPPLGIVPGHNYTLNETIALNRGRHLGYWGPYEITPQPYYRAAQRVAYLQSGATSYKMAVLLRDRLREPALHNQPGGAINCIMAVSDIGGRLDTGTAWGEAASGQVLQFLSPEIMGTLEMTYPNIAEQMSLGQRLSGR